MLFYLSYHLNSRAVFQGEHNKREPYSQELYWIKILLIHHHFYKELICKTNSNLTLLEKIEKQTMKLRGKKRLIKLLVENDVKLVLHGHLHESCEYFKKGIRFLNAGATLDSTHQKSICVNEIEINPASIKVTIRNIFESKLQPLREFYPFSPTQVAV